MTEPGLMFVKVMPASVPDDMEFLRAVLKASCCSGPKLATDMSASVAVKATWGYAVAGIAAGPGAVPAHTDRQLDEWFKPVLAQLLQHAGNMRSFDKACRGLPLSIQELQQGQHESSSPVTAIVMEHDWTVYIHCSQIRGGQQRH